MVTKKASTTTPPSENLTSGDFVKAVEQTGDAVLTALAEIQEGFLKAAESITSQFPAAPEFNVPGLESTDLRLPREIVAANLAFAEKYLANQKTFAEKWLNLSGV